MVLFQFVSLLLQLLGTDKLNSNFIENKFILPKRLYRALLLGLQVFLFFQTKHPFLQNENRNWSNHYKKCNNRTLFQNSLLNQLTRHQAIIKTNFKLAAVIKVVAQFRNNTIEIVHRKWLCGGSHAENLHHIIYETVKIVCFVYVLFLNGGPAANESRMFTWQVCARKTSNLLYNFKYKFQFNAFNVNFFVYKKFLKKEMNKSFSRFDKNIFWLYYTSTYSKKLHKFWL